ncbi:MAG: FAD-dependent oxidoreductase [Planctomycetota bacterium]
MIRAATSVKAVAVCLALWVSIGEARSIMESQRSIPIAYSVDVVVVGGATHAVEAAAAAARKGATVFLAAPRPYLGDDLCATLRLWRPPGKDPATDLGRRLFSPSAQGDAVTPHQIKATLDEALLDAGVQFLYGCYATDVLVDSAGKPAGIVMANRAGRQAVVARVILDATDRAVVARLAGAQFRPWPGGRHEFRRIVIGNNVRTGEGVRGSRTGITVSSREAQKTAEFIEYSFTLPVADGSFAELARAEQRARDLTFAPDNLDEAETLSYVPPDAMHGRAALEGPWPGADKVDLGIFRPKGVERIYVLSGCADITREVAGQLLQPMGLMEVAHRIGEAAAEEASQLAPPDRPRLAGSAAGESSRVGEVKETLRGVRPVSAGLPTVPAGERALPVLGEYDVVVIGGGTSGAPAGIAAARQGVRTLVVEYLHGLGGVGTLGLIGRYHRGRQVGFTAEVDRGVAALEGAPKPGREWNVHCKMEWWRREIVRAGGDIWFGAVGCGAVVADGCVRGVVVATPAGRGVVLAKVVVDATGNADAADAAGAETVFVGPSHIAVQGTGLPVRPLGASYRNSDYLLVDDSDMLDTWRAFIAARRKGGYDTGQLIDTRERRRIVGDYTLTILDQMTGRTFPDTVVQSLSNYDSHGYPIHPYFALVPPGKDGRPSGGSPYTPYRCLLPKGLDGILVIGLGASAHRDAMALIRMQADLQNQGYAAGVAAAMAVKANKPLREINIRALQKHLVEIGNIPEEVLTHKDSFPLPNEEIAAAVEGLGRGPVQPRNAAVVLSHQDIALPLLRKAYGAAEGDAKLTYARFLGMCGDATGIDTLIAALDAVDTWDAKLPLGVAADYSQLPTPVDGLIYALGYARDKRALPAILRKAETLDANVDLSHHQAVAIALETLGDPSAAPVLASVIGKPGIMGHAVTTLQEPGSRILPLREIILARALYRCGDHGGLGEQILRGYLDDQRGVLARHAKAVLEASKDRR